MKHTVIFSREGEPETNLLLEFTSAQPDTASAFRQLHSVLYHWTTSNVGLGASLLQESAGDFNIGDLACSFDQVCGDASFQAACEAAGVSLDRVQSVDLRVPYDRVLCQPPKEA